MIEGPGQRPGPSSLCWRSSGLGAVPAGVLPTFHRVRARWGNGCRETFEGARRVGLHAEEEVLVGLDCVGDVGVTESFAHDFDRYAFFDEEAAVGVAEVVEADDGDVGASCDTCERLGE